jgi:hypothetical protein
MALAVGTVTLIAWPAGNYHWTIELKTPYNAVSGADPVYWLAPVSVLTSAYATLTWPYLPALTEAILASLGAIGAYVLLGKWLDSRGPRETTCCGCGEVLLGLIEPQCPECGLRL